MCVDCCLLVVLFIDWLLSGCCGFIYLYIVCLLLVAVSVACCVCYLFVCLFGGCCLLFDVCSFLFVWCLMYDVCCLLFDV